MEKALAKFLNKEVEFVCDRCKKKLTRKHKSMWVMVEGHELLLCSKCSNLLLTFLR